MTTRIEILAITLTVNTQVSKKISITITSSTKPCDNRSWFETRPYLLFDGDEVLLGIDALLRSEISQVRLRLRVELIIINPFGENETRAKQDAKGR